MARSVKTQKKTTKKPAAKKAPVKKTVVKKTAAKKTGAGKKAGSKSHDFAGRKIASVPVTPDLGVARELSTLRDFIRYAVSCFGRADLFYGHGTFTPFDEAAYLVLEGLKLPIDQLEPYYDAVLTMPERKRLAQLIHARVTTRKPTPYLVNRAYLQGMPFYVDERVIVPRSYIAEILVKDLTSDEIGGLVENPLGVTTVLDLCTGSGCLAILAAELFPEAEVDAIDLSPDALAVAAINVENSVYKDRVTLHRGDLFAPLRGTGKTFDLIITNPPYVDAEDMTDMPAEYLHEPRMALAAGDDGLDIVHRILREAPDFMSEDGVMICEIGYGRAPLEEAYPDMPFLWIDTENSYGEVFWITRQQIIDGLKAAAAA